MLSPANPAAPAHGSVGCVLAWPLNPFTVNIPGCLSPQLVGPPGTSSAVCGHNLPVLELVMNSPVPVKLKKATESAAEELPQAEMTFLWQLLKPCLKRGDFSNRV